MQVYGIPPEKLGIVENSNRSTIDSADYLFAKSILVPQPAQLARRVGPRSSRSSRTARASSTTS
jgi:hypothetical protein